MTLWEILGLLGILALWGALGLVPWSVALIVGRGRGALVALPLAFFAGIGVAALIPALGGKGGLGLLLSLIAAMAAGAVVSATVVVRAIRTMQKEPS